MKFVLMAMTAGVALAQEGPERPPMMGRGDHDYMNHGGGGKVGKGDGKKPHKPCDPYQAVKKACQEDFERACADADISNLGAMIACMKTQEEVVSPDCMGAMKDSFPALFACAEDLTSTCPSVADLPEGFDWGSEKDERREHRHHGFHLGFPGEKPTDMDRPPAPNPPMPDDMYNDMYEESAEDTTTGCCYDVGFAAGGECCHSNFKSLAAEECIPSSRMGGATKFSEMACMDLMASLNIEPEETTQPEEPTQEEETEFVGTDGAGQGCCYDVGYGAGMAECCHSNFNTMMLGDCEEKARIGGATKFSEMACGDLMASLDIVTTMPVNEEEPVDMTPVDDELPEDPSDLPMDAHTTEPINPLGRKHGNFLGDGDRRREHKPTKEEMGAECLKINAASFSPVCTNTITSLFNEKMAMQGTEMAMGWGDMYAILAPPAHPDQATTHSTEEDNSGRVLRHISMLIGGFVAVMVLVCVCVRRDKRRRSARAGAVQTEQGLEMSDIPMAVVVTQGSNYAPLAVPVEHPSAPSQHFNPRSAPYAMPYTGGGLNDAIPMATPVNVHV